MSEEPTARRRTPAKPRATSQAGPGRAKTKPAKQATQQAEADQARIAQRACELYEQRGRQDGRAWEDWLNAEGEAVSAPAESRSPSRP